MPFIARIRGLLSNLLRGGPSEGDLDAEIDATLDLLAAEKERNGLSPGAARRAARIELGGPEGIKERVRDAQHGSVLLGWMADVRHAVRGMRRTPGFTFIVVATLGVGLGAATAIFGVANAVLLSPLPYPQSDRLALIWAEFGPTACAPVSGHQLLAWRERSRLFETVSGIWVNNAALTGRGEPEQLKLGYVTANLLPLLAERPALGRHFRADDEGPGRPPTLMLTDGLWRRRFGADPSIVGSVVQLDGRAVEVVGVLPEGFRAAFPEVSRVPPDLDAFIPMPFDLAGGPLDVSYIRLLGRLRPGVTPRQAQAEADRIGADLQAEFDDYASMHLAFRVAPLHGEVARTSRPAILALSGGVLLVLLIACINVASLLLARGAERQREITLRSALGAAPLRLARLLLTESVCFAAAGGALALLLGSWALRALMSLQPEGIGRRDAIGLDLTVYGFALAITLVAGVLAGLAPSLAATRGSIACALRRGGRGQAGGAHRARNILIGCEVALGCAVLASAGLMARTMDALLRVDPGFEPKGALTLQVSLPGPRYPEDGDRVGFARRLTERLEALPGVEAAGMGSNLPLDDGLPNWYSPYWADGMGEAEREGLMADHRSVLPGYFASIGARFLEGRDFDAQDVEQRRLVAVVDDMLARRMWPGRSAVGRRLSLETMIAGDFKQQVAEVIGVVRHVQFHSLVDEVREQIFIAYPLAARQQISFVVRTAGDPGALAGPARAAVTALDPDLPPAKVLPLAHYVERARRAARFVSLLTAALAGIALLLAVVGVYGVSSAGVTRRTGEIGVRVALGAGRWDVMRLVLAQGMKPVAIGCLAGTALSILLAPLYAHLLYGVRALDASTHAAVPLLLALAGLIACYVPARRAVRLDPLEALRAE